MSALTTADDEIGIPHRGFTASSTLALNFATVRHEIGPIARQP